MIMIKLNNNTVKTIDMLGSTCSTLELHSYQEESTLLKIEETSVITRDSKSVERTSLVEYVISRHPEKEQSTRITQHL